MGNRIVVNQAVHSDIPEIAALFTESFKESVLHHCGQLPKPIAMQDVFSLVYQAEPTAAFVARSFEDGRIVGYCFSPAKLHTLWLEALLGGHILKWAWRWLTGRYGFGLHPVKVMIINKLAFLQSALSPTEAADARILSIAVDANYRNKGIAKQLMAAAMDYFLRQKVKRVRLEVRPDNFAAVRVYEKLGFDSAGFTYDSQGPWLIMFKEMEKDGYG